MARCARWLAGGSSTRSHRAERLATLAALKESDAGSALEELLRLNGAVALAPFALARNLTLDQLRELVAAGGFMSLGEGRDPYAASEAHLTELGVRLAETLAELHRAEPDALGIARPALLRRLRGAAPEPVLDAALAASVTAGQIVRDGAVLRLPSHQPRLSRDDERLWQQVEPLLAVADLRPPRVRELAEALGLQPEAAVRLMKRYERFGRVAPVASNRYFLPETVAQLALIARELADSDPSSAFTAVSFKDRSGVGRNLTIEILEYLDRIGVTRRVGDARVVLLGGLETLG
jgi:selenocysteine-specific elongation factor